MLVKGDTMDDVLAVIAWSLRYAFLGTFPAQRHDGQPWTAQDTWRKKRAGSTGIRSTLVRITGDWKMYKEIWRFPLAQPAQRHLLALRGHARHVQGRFGQRPLAARSAGPLGIAPADLRSWPDPVPASGLAVLRYPLALSDRLAPRPRPRGRIGLDRSAHGLLAPPAGRPQPRGEDQDLVGAHPSGVCKAPPPACLDNLTENMLNLGGRGAPKLKVHGVECRGLVPVARDLAVRCLGDDINDQAVREATFELARCYDALSHTVVDQRLVLADACKRFSTLYIVLDQQVEPFHIRPKLHMAQELLEMQQGTPTRTWTYRDEDFGGTMVQLF